MPDNRPNVVVRIGRHIRRRWRRWRRRWLAPQVRFIYHDAYAGHLDAAPVDPTRGEKILGFLVDEGLLDRDDISVPRLPAVRSLLRVHDLDYIDAVGRDPELTERIFGERVSDAQVQMVLGMQRLAVGGTIQATRLALQGRSVAINLAGGYHHAARDRGMGFCIFNDVAVAVARLRSKGFKEPVLIVDLDVHDGNGTREIFAHDTTVHTYSVHNENWGKIEAVASTSIALGADVGDEIYLGTLLKTLPDVMMNVRPGLVIYLAGDRSRGGRRAWQLADNGRRDVSPRPSGGGSPAPGTTAGTSGGGARRRLRVGELALQRTLLFVADQWQGGKDAGRCRNGVAAVSPAPQRARPVGPHG